MAIFYLILGVLAATLLGVLSDWLVKPHLPEKPTQRHIVTAIVVCIVLIVFAVLPYLITPSSSTEVPVSPTKLSPTALFISTNIFAPTNTAIILIATQTRSPIPPTPLPSSTPAVSSTQVSTKDGMVLIYIPAGDFLMGSADSDKESNSDEKPQHKVFLDAFWIDKTEVTNAMYARCVQAGACQALIETKSFARSGYYASAQFKDFPVIYTSWDDAGKYCKWAERRLPTEAEWEKAARGAEGKLYPWGDTSPSPSLLNFNKNVGDTTQVGKYPDGASTYGVLDMAGNVWEWVADWYDEKYYSKSPNRNPDGPASGGFGILRGGAWVTEANYVRAAQRLKVAFDFRDSIVGFRCAR